MLKHKQQADIQDIEDIAGKEVIFSQRDFKRDSYMKSRGEPKMLQLFCNHCDKYLMTYQKDGPGELKRCYLDRIHHPKELVGLHKKDFDVKTSADLNCEGCEQKIGQPMIYEPEKRPAYLMFKDKSHFKTLKL